MASVCASSVGAHITRPMPVVWMPRLVSVDRAMLRGYRNSSRQGVRFGAGMLAGSSICEGSTCNAHAIDWRASSGRPIRISQRGDSGTQARISKVMNAGSRPTRNSPRHPTSGAI